MFAVVSVNKLLFKHNTLMLAFCLTQSAMYRPTSSRRNMFDKSKYVQSCWAT